MSNSINHTRLYITGLFHSHSIFHYKVPGTGALHQALLEGWLHCPCLLTVAAAVLLVETASIHPAVVAASVPRTSKRTTNWCAECIEALLSSEGREKHGSEFKILVGVDDNVGSRVDGEQQVVHLDQEHDPTWVFWKRTKPHHLQSFIEVDNDLGRMAAEEDNDYGHQKPGHGVVSPMSWWYVVVSLGSAGDGAVDHEV